MRRRLENEDLRSRTRSGVEHRLVGERVVAFGEAAQDLLTVLRARRNVADYDVEMDFPSHTVTFTLICARRLLEV
jgi:hypothetical protein